MMDDRSEYIYPDQEYIVSSVNSGFKWSYGKVRHSVPLAIPKGKTSPVLIDGVSTCAACMNRLDDEEYVSALGQDWHSECFRCCACDVALSSWYLEKDGLLFCENDYWVRYGECCRQCSQVITGPVMVAGEHRFHPECFACAACGVFIEDGEPYALLERSILYCGGCYKNFMQPLGKGKAAHSIRIVEIPPRKTGDGKPQIRLAASDKRGTITPDYGCKGVTIQEMDKSCGLVALHVGDRILEINGTPIRSQPVEEIERALCTSDSVLQLTIEHDPENSVYKPHRCRLSDEPKAIKHASDTKSRIERRQLKVEAQNIPEPHSIDNKTITKHSKDIENNKPDLKTNKSTLTSESQSIDKKEEKGKERLFKRKNEVDSGKRMKRRETPESPLLGEKERSSSMSKLLDVVCSEEDTCMLNDLSRTRSFRVDMAANQRVFRAGDLLQGELLGCGFFGQVYRVTHRDTGEVMVLKQLYRVDEDAQRNFLKEVAVLRSLKHGNVLRFIGVLYKDKRLHLVTEYVAGGTLQQLLQDPSVSLCWATRARLARDIAAGVGYLHRMSIIHRDLNSHNCLIREDKTVIVADFGLARIVQRAASAAAGERASTLSRRKRYTVVGNPYWMAPEMMKGNVYDEKVDVFSFGIILCEIIGRVQADPDFLPRRSDFGLNEALFRDKFCTGCPEPLCRLAFLCCDLNPDQRPPFEVMEVWLGSLVMHLSLAAPLPPDLLPGLGGAAGEGGCRCEGSDETGALQSSRIKSAVDAPPKTVNEESTRSRGRALGKCVSASQICQHKPTVTITNLSRSQHTLHTAAGFILRAHGKNINITKVDDISEWVDPPAPLKRSSFKMRDPTRKVEQDETHLPPFLRNQSVEGLETRSKDEVDYMRKISRHFSTPNCESDKDSDLSDDDKCSWYRRIDPVEVKAPKVVDIVENGKKFLNDQEVELRHPLQLGMEERKINDENSKRYNINHIANAPGVSQGIKCLQEKFNQPPEKPVEKNHFFSKKLLLSPKLGRLFKPNTAEVERKKVDDTKSPKLTSKFFIPRPPESKSSYRVSPIENQPKTEKDMFEEIKLTAPLTPQFRRHTQQHGFQDGRFSCRESRNTKPKFAEIRKSRVITPGNAFRTDNQNQPLSRCGNTSNIPALGSEHNKWFLREATKSEPKKLEAITKGNYVSLANLKINSKPIDNKVLPKTKSPSVKVPVERVI